MTKKYAVLILSCDKYSDLWRPFFFLFKKYWPDCPYPVYLESNTTLFNQKNITPIFCGKDINWSESLKKTLEQIPEKYLCILLDDTFLNHKINTKLFNRCFNFMDVKNANHMHFRPWPKPDKAIGRDFGIYEKKMPYRVNVIGLWRKEYLYNLLINGENPWNFEIFGSYRSSYDDGFFCSNKNLLHYIHVVEKGKWLPQAMSYCKKNNVPIDIDKREELKIGSAFLSYIANKYFMFIYSLNWKKRLMLMDLLRKFIISY